MSDTDIPNYPFVIHFLEAESGPDACFGYGRRAARRPAQRSDVPTHRHGHERDPLRDARADGAKPARRAGGRDATGVRESRGARGGAGPLRSVEGTAAWVRSPPGCEDDRTG